MYINTGITRHSEPNGGMSPRVQPDGWSVRQLISFPPNKSSLRCTWDKLYLNLHKSVLTCRDLTAGSCLEPAESNQYIFKAHFNVFFPPTWSSLQIFLPKFCIYSPALPHVLRVQPIHSIFIDNHNHVPGWDECSASRQYSAAARWR